MRDCRAVDRHRHGSDRRAFLPVVAAAPLQRVHVTNTFIVARGVSYAVGGAKLVHPLSLGVAAGQLTVIIGPNGAGKSTLLKLLTGKLRPAISEALCGASRISNLPHWQLACRRAVMAQQARMAFAFTAWDVVRLGVDGIGRARERAQMDQIVSDAMLAADVTHLAARLYPTLSGGEQQRVQFARALVQLSAGRTIETAQALFLDEPIASLDLNHQLALLDHARRIAAGGVAVLAVLHDVNLAITFADHLVVMAHGTIAAEGTPADVVTEKLLADVFGVKAKVGRTDDGQPFILPQLRAA